MNKNTRFFTIEINYLFIEIRFVDIQTKISSGGLIIDRKKMHLYNSINNLLAASVSILEFE